MTTETNHTISPRIFHKRTLALTIASVMAVSHAYAQDNGAEPDEIIVTGIRASLQSAADFKKKSDVIVDSITAEDIGKFPDANVADSLQRVTGVQISRDRGGEGRYVSVRGLGSQFNMTTMNGRTLATDNAGRDFSFDVMPSELISQADVYKSSAANLEEGSIGGLISVKTRKPLDTPGLHIAGSVGAQYDGGTEKTNPQATLVVSDSFMDDTLGASFGVTYSDREWKATTYELLQAQRTATFTPTGGVNAGKVTQAWMPDIVSLQYKFGERERLGAAGALQFKPNEQIDTTLDFFYSNYKTPEGAYSFNINFGSVMPGSTIDIYDYRPWSTPSRGIDYELVKFSAVTDLEMGNDSRVRETDTYMVGWNTIYQATDNLKLTFDIAASEADRPNKGDDLYTVSGMKGFKKDPTDPKGVRNLPLVNYMWESTADGPPKINCTLTDGRSCGDITNADIDLHYMDLKGEQVNDKANSFHFDGDYSFEFMNLESHLQFGVAYSERTKDRDIYKGQDPCYYCFSEIPSRSRNVAAVGVNVVEGVVDYDTGKNTILNHWPKINPYKLFEAAQAYDNIEGKPGQFEKAIAPSLDKKRSTYIEENNTAAYVQGNIKGDTWNLVAGVRWISTDATSSGHISGINSIIQQSASNYNVIFTPDTPISEDSDYNKVLPSASFNWDLMENAKLRLAASQTITRPTFSQLGTDVQWEAGSGFPRINGGGNPNLKPITSNNYDVSFEWYEGGLSASAAVYYKEITDWIFYGPADRTFVISNLSLLNSLPEQNVSRTFRGVLPINGDEATLTGFELNVQKVFDNGFGIQANYTYADSEATTTANGITVKGELDGVSNNTYNVMGFYEKDAYSVRLSYSFRDKYVSQARGGNWGNPQFNKDFAGLDLSASYNINDNFSVYLEAQNLLEENGQTYWGDSYATHYYEQYYSRFEIGARFKF